MAEHVRNHVQIDVIEQKNGGISKKGDRSTMNVTAHIQPVDKEKGPPCEGLY
ncbi:hypothetical protein GCM10020331_062270 [Ectobacillus funiculus]